MSEQQWCTIESLSMQDEKVFVILEEEVLDLNQDLFSIEKLEEKEEETGKEKEDKKLNTFVSLKKYLEQKLKSTLINVNH